jgi:probable rRNA maturation factor
MRSSKTDANANGLEVAVLLWTSGWRDAVAEVEELCRAAAARALEFGGSAGTAVAAEVSIVLSDDATIAGLNRSFRQLDGPTNVLAFPADDGASDDAGSDSRAPRLLGDIIIALETAAREAADQDKTLADHLRHLVVHGMLHLLRYDHQSDEDAEVMEGLEIAVLASFGVADPYAESEQGTLI